MRAFGGRTTAVAVAIRIVIVLAVGTVGWGCHRQAPAAATLGDRLLALLEVKGDTGVALRAMMLRDTVAAGDSAPVEVLYGIVNGPLRTPFANDPGQYEFVVTGPDSQPAKALGGQPASLGAAGRQTELVLPAGGVLLQRQDLRCVNVAGYSSIMLSPGEIRCLAIYALTEPGPYRVIVNYYGPTPDSVLAAVLRRDREKYRELSPWQVLHLADTVTLIVVDR
jgi:hypothetical protein